MKSLTKRTRQLACLLIVLSVHSALGADEEGTQLIDLEDLTIEIPDTWNRIQQEETLLTAVAPLAGLGDSFGENIRLCVYPAPARATLDDLLAVQLRAAEKGFEIAGSGELNSGRDRVMWLTIIPKSTPFGEEVLAKTDYLLLRGDKCYVAHFMVEAEQLEERQPQFEAIVRSIAFKKAAPRGKGDSGDRDQQRHREAFEGGKMVGRVTAYVMLSVIVLVGLISLVKRVFRKSGAHVE